MAEEIKENASAVESMTSRGAMSGNVTVARRFSQVVQLLTPSNPAPVSMMIGRRGLRNKKFSAVIGPRVGCCGESWKRADASGAGIFVDVFWCAR
jgi:hypothetical protein